MYTYTGRVVNVVDGDTVDIEIDLGFKIHHTMRARLAGIDAPERFTDAGKEATAWLHEQVKPHPIDPGPWLTVQTGKDTRDKYGRYVVTLLATRWPTSINQRMIIAGHAERYYE